MKKYTVYKHTAPNGKVYIGITSQSVNRRWQNGKHYETNKFFKRAILKYGWDNFKHEIIASNLSQKEACELEIMLIESIKSRNPKYGYNICSGGEKGSIGHTVSDETKEKLRVANLGKKLSGETKRKISEHSKTISHIEEGKKKSKAVKCIETNVVYYGVREASRQTCISSSSICLCCKGKLKQAGGYQWEYM